MTYCVVCATVAVSGYNINCQRSVIHCYCLALIYLIIKSSARPTNTRTSTSSVGLTWSNITVLEY